MDRVRLEASVLMLLLFGSAITLTLSAHGMPGFGKGGYSHGTAACLQGNDGPGTRIRLTQHRSCGAQISYPYLEIEIRDLPISAGKSIPIGETNTAFRCQGPKNACEQSLSGEVIFNRYEETSEKELQTDGHYELRFNTGPPEAGHFKVDCMEPCG
jgi:hypothetical protein